MEQPSPAEVARQFHVATSEQELSELVSLLKRDSGHARAVLEALSRSKVDIKLWLTDSAVEILNRDAIPILRGLLRDRDSDVRIEALRAIVELDLDEARRISKTLRRRAQSKDLYEAQAALWALGAIRDMDALSIISEATQRDDAIPRNTAFAVELLLTDAEQLCRRIEEHDHELMPWLAKAAELLGTERAKRALERCLAKAPDEECKFWANEMLARFSAEQ